MRPNNQQTLQNRRESLPDVLTKTCRPNASTINHETTGDGASDEVQSRLYRALDLILEAVAVAQPLNEEVAHFAMLAALVAGERLGLRDEAVYRMRDSAIAEAKRN